MPKKVSRRLSYNAYWVSNGVKGKSDKGKKSTSNTDTNFPKGLRISLRISPGKRFPIATSSPTKALQTSESKHSFRLASQESRIQIFRA